MPFSAGGPPHPSEYRVSVEGALRLAPLYAGARLLADSVASLPIQQYRRTPGGPPVKLATSPLLDQPASYGTVYDWLHQAMVSLVLQGNAWGLITQRDGYGYPLMIEWLPAERVTVTEDEKQPWNPARATIEFYGTELRREDLFHVRAFTMPGKLEGLSPIRLFMTLIGAGNDALEYGASWYRAGGWPPGTFQNAELEVDEDQANEVRRRLTRAIQRREPLVFGRDWDYKPVSVPPSEAQFLDAIQANATQIAAILGIPPERIGGKRGDSLTYSCVDRETEILTLRGWLRYDQVTTGDTCLGLNPGTGMAEWQPVDGVHVFGDGPYRVIRLENTSHSSVSTENHRWPVKIFRQGKGDSDWAWRRTDQLGQVTKILAAAPVQAPAEPKWSDALVELVAWVWTEGHIRASGAVQITQSERVNPGMTARIRSALKSLIGPVTPADDPVHVHSRPAWREWKRADGVRQFNLNKRAGALLTQHAPGKVPGVAWLAELTRAQLELFIQTSIEADGWSDPRWGTKAMLQKDRARLDAFQVALALAGYSGAVKRTNDGSWRMYIRKTPWRRPAQRRDYISEETAPAVWCVTTPTHNWFARRAGTTYFTGNTQEQESISLAVDTLRPWLVRLETALFDVLPQQQYVRFNVNAMMKTTVEQRFNVYKTSRDMGIKTVDEIRALEEDEPLGQGVGSDPLALQVLVAMARGIKEIPKSFEQLVTESPADTLAREQALTLAKEAKVAQPPPPIYPTTQAPAGPQAQNGQAPANSNNGQAGQGNGHG